MTPLRRKTPLLINSSNQGILINVAKEVEATHPESQSIRETNHEEIGDIIEDKEATVMKGKGETDEGANIGEGKFYRHLKLTINSNINQFLSFFNQELL